MLAIVGTLGYIFSVMPGRGVAIDRPSAFSGLTENQTRTKLAAERVPEQAPPSEPRKMDRFAELPSPARDVLQAAQSHLGSRRFDAVLANLNAHRERLMEYPETYLLLGAALEGKKQYNLARDFYHAAIQRNPYMAEAHFGFATTSENLGDLESALGGMRSFLHTTQDLDPERLQVAQARSAIWEWEAKLGRGPWGPTQGIPPGFSKEELERDGRGVGIKIPIPGTEQADGSVKYEIKAQAKFPLFKP